MTKLQTPTTVVHKFDVAISDTPTMLNLHRGARIALVAQQAGSYAKTLQLWAVIPTREGVVAMVSNERRFEVYGTGHAVPAGREHVGSVVASNGGVWHVFEAVS